MKIQWSHQQRFAITICFQAPPRRHWINLELLLYNNRKRERERELARLLHNLLRLFNQFPLLCGCFFFIFYFKDRKLFDLKMNRFELFVGGGDFERCTRESRREMCCALAFVTVRPQHNNNREEEEAKLDVGSCFFFFSLAAALSYSNVNTYMNI